MTQPSNHNAPIEPTDAEVEAAWQDYGAIMHDVFGSTAGRLSHDEIRNVLRESNVWDEEQEREVQECLAATEHDDRH